MNLTVPRDPLLEKLAARPDSTGVFCDFDGTLAPIVDHPEDASAAPGAPDALAGLSADFAVVAVISGRSLGDLSSRLDAPGVLLAGAYGRERSDRPAERPDADWDLVFDAARAAVGFWEGVLVERKGEGVALHYRAAPGRAGEVSREAERIAASYGLELRPGRMVVELTSPGPGKAEALRTLVEEHRLETFLVCGDDVADAEAFAWARGSGRSCVLVGVRSEEAPGEIEELADLVVDDPGEVVAFLEELRRRVRRPG